MSFRRELKELIARRSISQRELATRCGKSPAWVSRILRGSLPLKSLDEVLMIGTVLELPADEVNRLCQGYQSEFPSPYGVLLYDAAPAGARLALIDEGRDPATWGAGGGEVLRGSFSVLARSTVAAAEAPAGSQADEAAAKPATPREG